MTQFKGFSPDREQYTRIPDSFFNQLLAEIDDLDELKLTLYAFWFLDKNESPSPYLTRQDFVADDTLMAAISGDLDAACQKVETRGTLLCADAGEHRLYFLNTPRGRAALQAVEEGHWEYGGSAETPIKLNIRRPNLFSIYENNIGPITPIMSEKLKDAETQYPLEWIEQAIEIAVVNNVRKWPYVEAILKNWQEEGRNDRTDQGRGRQAEEAYDPERYTKGKFSDFIKS